MNYQNDFARGIKDLNFYHSFLGGTYYINIYSENLNAI